MKTIQLYYSDPYKTNITAKVLSVEPKGDLTNVILDQTLFYPEGGGQPSDKGTIGNTKIEYVRNSDGEIIHQVKGKIAEGDTVECNLDWNWRYKHMKIHTAGHLIHDILMTLNSNLKPLHGSHGKKAYLEYQGSLDPMQKDLLETKVNEASAQGLEVVTKESSYEELEKVCKFLPANLPKTKALRILQIGNFDPMPDGGVQVKNTKEIGRVSIISITNEADNTIVRYSVGGKNES